MVYNQKKNFSEGHTHLRSFKACKDAVTFVTNGAIPRTASNYYLTSLQRITNDNKYHDKIHEFMMARARKGKKQKYVNKNP